MTVPYSNISLSSINDEWSSYKTSSWSINDYRLSQGRIPTSFNTVDVNIPTDAPRYGQSMPSAGQSASFSQFAGSSSTAPAPVLLDQFWNNRSTLYNCSGQGWLGDTVIRNDPGFRLQYSGNIDWYPSSAGGTFGYSIHSTVIFVTMGNIVNFDPTQFAFAQNASLNNPYNNTALYKWAPVNEYSNSYYDENNNFVYVEPTVFTSQSTQVHVVHTTNILAREITRLYCWWSRLGGNNYQQNYGSWGKIIILPGMWNCATVNRTSYPNLPTLAAGRARLLLAHAYGNSSSTSAQFNNHILCSNVNTIATKEYFYNNAVTLFMVNNTYQDVNPVLYNNNGGWDDFCSVEFYR